MTLERASRVAGQLGGGGRTDDRGGNGRAPPRGSGKWWLRQEGAGELNADELARGGRKCGPCSGVAGVRWFCYGERRQIL